MALASWFSAFDDIVHGLVYSVLVDYCDAVDDESNRSQFAVFWGRGPREYRFIGSLGFGGKFWNSRHSWYVNCYHEDETPERHAAIERANRLLAPLHDAYVIASRAAANHERLEAS